MFAMTDRLIAALNQHDDLTIAVSGGVDSMTLAFIAHRFARGRIAMAHAVSPAVPQSASQILKNFAEEQGWKLTLIDAGELADPSYRDNPVDRCYFCKNSLYTRIRKMTDGTIASGTNLDDLGDYRPGLKAAGEKGVVHPFVEAGIGKDGIRAIARHHGLSGIAELPAQPCLASRIETGITIDPEDLIFIDRVERDIGTAIKHYCADHAIAEPVEMALRCRITHQGVRVEMSELENIPADIVTAMAENACIGSGRPFLGLRPYRRGSAFLREDGTGSSGARMKLT